MNGIIEQHIADLGIDTYLEQHQHKILLRFLTCGSVDDGKSTLIGRLLHDSRQIYTDQLAALQADSHKLGTLGNEPDLALLVDGLQAEREQGITIDVAYRYFSTQTRKFIIADTPGHEQYTRNMATGASNCDVAVILIDARKGLLDQTRRHSYIANLLGIEHVIVAVNKMDLVDYDQRCFESIREDYVRFADKLNPHSNIHLIPLSARAGDNVVEVSENTPWYHGPTLLSVLEHIDLEPARQHDEFCFPIQYVNRPNLDFRGFSGTLASGIMKVGDQVRTLPSEKTSQIARIVTFEGDLPQAVAGQAVTVTLSDEIDISRGDVIVSSHHPLSSSPRLVADIVWMAEQPLVPGRQYNVKIAGKTTLGSIEAIRHQVNINTLETSPTDTLPLNGIGQCEMSLTESIPFDHYQHCPTIGGLILIDPLTNFTVGAGMIRQALAAPQPVASNVSTFELELNALIRKHFPHWSAKDLSQQLG
ncbi:sulfate adenylyltransferase subunit CysN [Vibrio sp. 10N.261.46.E12]|uniref:sulfate adenylyltransferase subunit CysN n=1 Tax=unclassified Vibrio TaxID=2614977 RepID=UPI000977EB76|nr:MULTISPECIES: sulfate adenylyltransferase subunit CysN [unclassified Vibrio]OMO37678.1 sulfate adenylyltransferase subunit CysN [Vibrio sp. 10N.261.45.E1]PMJ26256.1 sulfate adenylyltransferase subunit CysN [Vibrio sp. 10N.286.45.B6]PML86985.1 sulfate adenylyltransferase subunit CysN [Vibrio sp. 10N.261.49.E11]PMM78642.1 sulfate adenylyltransferase subunit CysN [Vibrio sp. 10N.261.46.F12]PMM85762.1 sulfate adenylyltransferase subunit CysN [Vibrio sp. 10N.261.46.E8]